MTGQPAGVKWWWWKDRRGSFRGKGGVKGDWLRKHTVIEGNKANKKTGQNEHSKPRDTETLLRLEKWPRLEMKQAS